MAETKITPDEVKDLTNEALEIARIFIATIGVIPVTIPQLLMKLPALIQFFKQAKPHFEIIIKEIKD